PIYRFTFNHNQPADLFAYQDNRLLKSSASKGKWVVVNSPSDFTFWDLAFHQTDQSFVVAAGGRTPVGATSLKSLLISQDGGKSWEYRSTPLDFSQSVLLDSMNNKIIRIAGACPNRPTICIAVSYDRGRTWSLTDTKKLGFSVRLYSNP